MRLQKSNVKKRLTDAAERARHSAAPPPATQHLAADGTRDDAARSRTWLRQRGTSSWRRRLQAQCAPPPWQLQGLKRALRGARAGARAVVLCLLRVTRPQCAGGVARALLGATDDARC
jgi:hypothetical protein